MQATKAGLRLSFAASLLLITIGSSTLHAATQTDSERAAAGAELFMQNCSFCHGRDARGGDVGPDLVGSPLVQTDVGGEKISKVIQEGRFGTAMPSFNFSGEAISAIVAFLHTQSAETAQKEGGRGNVRPAELRTGNAEAGEEFFRGAGKCASCHSVTGDLAKVATHYQGLQLLLRMLNPPQISRAVTVSVQSKQVRGTLEYLDEFTIGLRGQDGTYHSWRVSDVTYRLDVPITAHSDLLQRYSDKTMHDLYAYLETLK